jgi:cytochrome c oxidase subunit 4
MSDQPQAEHSRHPTFKQYVLVAIILFAITIVEFLIIWPENRIEAFSTPILIILSIVKFAVVISFYMHLKFDNKLLTWIFLGGLALGTAVTFSLLFLFSAVSGATAQPRDHAKDNAVPFEEVHKDSPESPPDKPDQPLDKSPAEDSAAPETGLVALGQEIFTGAGGCFACHTIEGISIGPLGPDLTHIGTDASGRISGVSAQDYVTKSIRDPEAFVAEGVERAIPGLMTSAFTANLTDQQVEALVQFLLAQE